MKIHNIAELKMAFKKIRVSPKGRRHYPVLFKKAIVEAIKDERFRQIDVLDNTAIVTSNLYNWMQQYNDGLFTMEGTYAVSQKSKEVNQDILSVLEQELNTITEKIEIIKKARGLGLKVTG